VHFGGLGPTLDDRIRRHEPLAHRGHRKVGGGQDEPDVQLGPRLDLDRGLLAMVEEGRGQSQAASVLVHDLRRRPRTREEPGVEVGELGCYGTAHDDAGGSVLDGSAGHVERVLAFDLELGVRDRSGTRSLAGPRRREALPTQRAPDATRRDGDHDGEDCEQRDGDHHCGHEAREPGGVVRALQGVLLAR
jgi:hypothetical protein